jgi:hypothetical protein
MKASDFFIQGREFFGFRAPGIGYAAAGELATPCFENVAGP